MAGPPTSAQAKEAVRLLQVQLRSVLPENARSLAFASPYASREKSRLVLGLAEAIAGDGRKTLLVEADPALPAIRTPHYPPRESAGAGAEGLEALAPEGGAAFRHASLSPDLRADEIRLFLSRWVSMFDRVLLNGPPLLEGAQGVVLASCADATLLVIEAGRVATRDLSVVRALLERAGASLVGSVLAAGGETG